jgi:DNA-3-methyladenine glycosylase
MKRLPETFFQRDVLEVAPDLVGKYLVRVDSNGLKKRYLITETEAYKGEADLACHASKGRTARTEVMYAPGGCLYIYLIYGMYWMLNIVTGPKDDAQAVLIRCIEGFNGPGKTTRALAIDKSFNWELLKNSDRIWVEEGLKKPAYTCCPRVGVDYAGEYWGKLPWRFVLAI